MPGLDGPPQPAADQLVGLAGIPTALGVADDDPGREAGEHRRRDLAGVRALELVVDGLRADRDGRVSLGERLTDCREADERRADHPHDAGHPRSLRDRAGKLAGIGGRRVHLPVRRDDDISHAGIMAERQLAAPLWRPRRLSVRGRHHVEVRRRPWRRPIPSSSWSASRSTRSSARWTADRWIVRRAASSDRLASGVSRRAAATSRTTGGCRASRPSASSIAIASRCRPAALTARWRFADSAFRTRFSSPRSARDTCRASISRSVPAAPMRRRNVPTASPFLEVTTPRPRRTRHDTGRPISASRAARIGASAGSTTNSRCVRPPARLREPRARKRPRVHAKRQ